MAKLENYRALTLYKRSLDLVLAVYQFVENHKDYLNKQEAHELRKTAISITMNIAFGIGQVNMKICFKQLNVAKDDLLPMIVSRTQNLIGKYQLNSWEGEMIDDYSTQVTKLIKAHLAWLSKNKS